MTEEERKQIESQWKKITEFQDTVSKSISFWAHIHQKQERRISELEAANAVLSTRCQAMFSLLPDETKIGDIQKAVARLKGEK